MLSRTPVPAAAGALVPYLCECDRPHCTELLLMTQAEYAEASGGLRRFVVAPGHRVAHARLVYEGARYWAVERRG